jgi:hypothetical protein
MSAAIGSAPSHDYEGEHCNLAHNHKRLLLDSAIEPSIARERKYRTEHTKAHLKRLGFSDSQARVPALLIPLYNVRGDPAGYQLRPDEPRVVDGDLVKYETPKGMGMVIDVHPQISCSRASQNPNAHLPGEPLRLESPPLLGDGSVPLVVTEGVRKGDAGVSIGLCTIAVLGVWSWRGRNAAGGFTALADWENITLKSRATFIAFDSDVMLKREVYKALVRLKPFLESRGAAVRLIYLPPGEHGKKVGLDDFIFARLQAGLSKQEIITELFALATDELRPVPGDGRENTGGHYSETAGGLTRIKHTPEGEVEIPLTNFTARIVGDVERDDGAETTRLFEIEARIGERTLTFGRPSFSVRRHEMGGRALGC